MLFTHRHLCCRACRSARRHDTPSIFFSTAFTIRFCHALCPSLLIIFYWLRFALPMTKVQLLHKQPCSRGHGRPYFFAGGKAVAGLCPLFVRALYRAWLPRTPTRQARARMVLTVSSVVVKFISYPGEQKCRMQCSKVTSKKDAQR